MISISVVSHGQAGLVANVLHDLESFGATHAFEVLLTLNIEETLPFAADEFSYPVRILRNVSPKGFGANHNAALQLASGLYFCVMNPDIRLPRNPFPCLLEELAAGRGAVIAPISCSPEGHSEDSVRYFPTPVSLFKKALRMGDGRYTFQIGDTTFAADWVGGMFMLFNAADFRSVDGFDEGFFLYYEDVDICARLWGRGARVLACPRVQVVHAAQRTSRRNLIYMRWHGTSLLRYLGKHWLRLPNTGDR